MDFFKVCHREKQKNVGGERQTVVEIFPSFSVLPSQDLMVRGKEFFAIWDPDTGFWSTDEYRARELIDQELWTYRDGLDLDEDIPVTVHALQNFSSQAWSGWRRYLSSLPDNFHDLDGELTWASDKRERSKFATRALPYSVEPGETPNYDLLVQRLYLPEEREKFEWAIGAILAGEARKIQKFLVFYGQAGTGKSTIIGLIEQLFEGYTTTFEAKALGANGNAFAAEVFKNNPLVGIQHDGDLSRIEDNTKLNSIVGHDVMSLNEKYKAPRDVRLRAFLFMGTNRPVKITDAKSGIIRRLIDVHPTGRRLSVAEYHQAVARLPFELGAIAAHCLEVYRRLGKDYYSEYVPMAMIEQTDPFFDFVRSYSDQFVGAEDGVTLKQAYDWYKEYVDECGLQFKMPRYRFQERDESTFEHATSLLEIAVLDRKTSLFDGRVILRIRPKQVKLFNRSRVHRRDVEDLHVEIYARIGHHKTTLTGGDPAVSTLAEAVLVPPELFREISIDELADRVAIPLEQNLGGVLGRRIIHRQTGQRRENLTCLEVCGPCVEYGLGGLNVIDAVARRPRPQFLRNGFVPRQSQLEVVDPKIQLEPFEGLFDAGEVVNIAVREVVRLSEVPAALI